MFYVSKKETGIEFKIIELFNSQFFTIISILQIVLIVRILLTDNIEVGVLEFEHMLSICSIIIMISFYPIAFFYVYRYEYKSSVSILKKELYMKKDRILQSGLYLKYKDFLKKEQNNNINEYVIKNKKAFNNKISININFILKPFKYEEIDLCNNYSKKIHYQMFISSLITGIMITINSLYIKHIIESINGFFTILISVLALILNIIAIKQMIKKRYTAIMMENLYEKIYIDKFIELNQEKIFETDIDIIY